VRWAGVRGGDNEGGCGDWAISCRKVHDNPIACNVFKGYPSLETLVGVDGRSSSQRGLRSDPSPIRSPLPSLECPPPRVRRSGAAGAASFAAPSSGLLGRRPSQPQGLYSMKVLHSQIYTSMVIE